MIGELPTTEKLDDTNYEIRHWKIQYPLNDKDPLENLTVAKGSLLSKDKDGKQIDTNIV